MIDSEKIINAIHQQFKSVEKEKSHDMGVWKGVQWNEVVKTALCRVGKNLGYSVWAKGVDVKTNGGEWLYDVIWLKYEDDLLTSCPMAAECEWEIIGEIKDDFEKLLLARTAVRVLVFNGMRHKDGSEAIANKVCNWIGAYEDSRKRDTYLLIATEKDGDKWWFCVFH